MKKLIMLRGLPGCGKTTLAEEFQNMFSVDGGIIAVSADDYFYNENGEYNFNPDKLHLAHQDCQQRAESNFNYCDIVVVHNTSTREREVKPYKEIADKVGAMFISLIVENRHNGVNSHNVPDETIEKMKNRFSVKL